MNRNVIDIFNLLGNGEYDDCKAYELRNQQVTLDFVLECSADWVGPHKNVHGWIVTECRHAIGMNENPAHGLSFPVIRLGQKRYRALLAEHGQIPLIAPASLEVGKSYGY